MPDPQPSPRLAGLLRARVAFLREHNPGAAPADFARRARALALEFCEDTIEYEDRRHRVSERLAALGGKDGPFGAIKPKETAADYGPTFDEALTLAAVVECWLDGIETKEVSS